MQLYVAMPAAAAEPPRILKGFQKVNLGPGEIATVTLALPDEALQVFDEELAGWTLVRGAYQVMIGASSRDIRQAGTFTVDGGGP